MRCLLAAARRSRCLCVTIFNLQSPETRCLQAPNTEGWVDPNSKSKKPKKSIDFTLHSLWGKQQEGATPVIQPEIFTASGAALRSQRVGNML